MIDNSGFIVAGGVSQLVVTTNPDRKWLYFQNNSSEDMYIDFGVDATSTQGIYVGGKQSFVFTNFVSLEAVNVIGSTGACFECKEEN